MFAGGAAAEVCAGHDHALAVDIFFRIEAFQDQVFQTVGLQSDFGAFSQIFCRNDFVCIDVRPVEKENFSLQIFHDSYLVFSP